MKWKKENKSKQILTNEECLAQKLETTLEAKIIWALLLTLSVTAAALMIKSFTGTLMCP